MKLYASFGLLAMSILVAPRSGSALPDYRHTATVVNNTGGPANDLHVDVPHWNTGRAPTAPPMAYVNTTAGVGVAMLNFSGAVVTNGTTVGVTWDSKFASDKIGAARWTNNGVNIGAGVVQNLAALTQDQGGGIHSVILDNQSGGSLSYTGLQLVINANSSFLDTPDPLDYVNGYATGTPVALQISASGMLPPGQTQIATVDEQLLMAGRYHGGQLLLGGALFAFAGFSRPPVPSLGGGGLAAVVAGTVLLSLFVLHRSRTRMA